MITGWYNFTGSAERDNDESLVSLGDPYLAQAYRGKFENVGAASRIAQQYAHRLQLQERLTH